MAETPLDAGPLVTGPWLVRLRWASVLAQAIAVGVAAWVVGLALPIAPIALLIGLLAGSNVVLGWRMAHGRPAAPRVFGWVLVGDVTLLTALLWLTGGSSNPFTAVYLVHIALSAVTLGARWTWVITATSVLGYAVMFLAGPQPAPAMDPVTGLPTHDMTGHLGGMWVAFVSAAVLIGYFVTRVREALDARERELAEARRLGAARERLASLTTLAAGAAHELATPLATIAVASQELVHAVEQDPAQSDLAEDARLIRAQVERCRQILDHMSGRADASVVDPPAPIDAAAVIQSAIKALPAAAAAHVRVQVRAPLPAVRLPRVGLARALTMLLENALDASPGGAPVDIEVCATGRLVRFAVRDEGCGMDAATLERAGEPFFTTKAPGAGFGLGLFLARTFVEQWGGQFTLSSAPGQGTQAAVEFAVDGHAA